MPRLRHSHGLCQHSRHFVHRLTNASNQWPGEDSFLVLGISLEAVKTLGRRFGQNAVLWCDATAIPQLILLDR